MLTLTVLKEYMQKEVVTITPSPTAFKSEFRAHLDSCHSQIAFCDKLL